VSFRRIGYCWRIPSPTVSGRFDASNRMSNQSAGGLRPMTLMQRWIGSESDVLGKDILVLMERFGRLGPLIDGLLDSRRR